ncbi:rhomboid family intramembrane serine protease GlpG [Vibrio sp. SM6]|uniref:Rhomboid family intramembrane serine protease GlpG n=1 Tax=Vibrio agarilyticus TaxID=2726741 RepID=A0A7X8YHL6_9VIBR|nr:rhomboid family intramembrane serine protease GlpG [Vibrio agarilyticus]NLS13631.1 rhomboid family intramembrane serine protease GlpG [Vibrio agarilyticus]
MKRLIALNNPRSGQAFIDYMATQHIDIRMMPEGEGQFSLWLVDDTHYDAVEVELQQFLHDPTAPRYRAASWDVGPSQPTRFRYASPSLMAMIRAKAGPVTLVVMFACVVIYALRMLGFGQGVFDALHFPADAAQQWQLWRWFTHALLHFSVTHIIFNLLWWWEFGGDIEKRLGSGKLLQIFLISAALSGAGQYWVEGANFGGLSGVVYALLGYLWIFGLRAPHYGLTVAKPLVAFMLIWLVLGFVQPFFAIANTAHLVGLIAGMALAWLDASKQKYQQ